MNTDYPINDIHTVSMYDFIKLHLAELKEEELNSLSWEITKALKLLNDKKPYYREPIPDYLLRWTYPYDKTKKLKWYSDVWYHAAKDGMMGKEINSPMQIPEDATHIVEIHK